MLYGRVGTIWGGRSSPLPFTDGGSQTEAAWCLGHPRCPFLWKTAPGPYPTLELPGWVRSGPLASRCCSCFGRPGPGEARLPRTPRPARRPAPLAFPQDHALAPRETADERRNEDCDLQDKLVHLSETGPQATHGIGAPPQVTDGDKQAQRPRGLPQVRVTLGTRQRKNWVLFPSPAQRREKTRRTLS